MLSRLRLGAVLALALAVTSVDGYQRSKQEADQFNSKMARIVSNGKAKPVGKAVPRTTEITDNELNAYLLHYAKDQIPPGVVEPTINAVGNSRLSGRVIVDLDVVRKQRQRGWLDPMGYLTGRLPLTATGTLSTTEGVGRFTLESAELSGITVPKTLIQELLSYYSKTPEQPNGINMDEPFELPAGIREIRVGQAQATVVQ